MDSITNFFAAYPWILGGGGLVAALALLWKIFGGKDKSHSADNGGVVNTGTAPNIPTNKPTNKPK